MHYSLLRCALVANAVFSALSGTVLVGFGDSVSDWLGGVTPWLLRLTGLGLLAFAAFLLWVSRRPTLRIEGAFFATMADLVWVAGSGVLLLLPVPAFSTAGTWTVVLVALVVLTFALLQALGFRALTRNHHGKTTARSSFEIARHVAAPPDAMWGLITDLERIGEFYHVLRKVEVQGDRAGARRTCENVRGQRWSEEVTEWDEQARAITLRFDTEAPDFPFPMREMYGGWSVDSARDGARVVIWYEYTVRGGILGEILAPLFAQRARSLMEATISNMEIAANQTAGVEPST